MKNVAFLLILPLVVVFGAPSERDAQPHTIQYSDSWARHKFVYASAAGFANEPERCLEKAFGKNFKLQRRLEVFCDITLEDKCAGYTAVSNEDKAIIIGYRGATNYLEMLMEGLETYFEHNVPWIVPDTSVSPYFANGFLNLWNGGMKDDFATLVAQYPSYQVWITGHSLGGAFASLAAHYITYNKLFDPSRLLLVTLGQPRVGNAAFVASHDSTVINSYRVTHAHDPTPHFPRKNVQGYTHHMAEVFYKENMNKGYRICGDVDESSLCSNGNLLPDASIKDHLHYFDVDVDKYGKKNCK